MCEFRIDRRQFITGCCCSILGGGVSGGVSAKNEGLFSEEDLKIASCSTPQVSDLDRMRTLQTYKNFSSLDGDTVGFDSSAGSLLTYEDFAFALESAVWKRSDAWKANDPGPWKLLVGLFDAEKDLRNEIMTEARKWTGPNGANLEFVETEDVASAHIRIRVETDFNDSALGRQARHRKFSGTHTMRLGYLSNSRTNRRQRKRIIQHEFGHVLGLRHEHQHPDSGLTWRTNEIVADHLGKNWGKCNTKDVTPAQLEKLCEESVRSFYLSHSISGHKLAEYDPDSVMLYTFPASFNDEGVEVSRLNLISPKDLDFAKRLYPA